ncbi:MAG TPA: aldolase/citrate lyase family protein [Solirubrobacteraceae bacterium]|jgi:4-hydroxy-2-oxoheptanedioate aldolase
MVFKERLQRGDVQRGVLSAIPSGVAAQAIAAAGADFLLIDREHGPIGREATHAMIAATAGTACAPLVRVPTIDDAEVKPALDAGAEGIMFPMIRGAEEAREAVALVRYPPEGRRGWGPFAAHARHGVAIGDYATSVGPDVVCGIMIETVEAVAAVDDILAVPGIDFVFVAQFDLSLALGVPAQFDAPALVEARAAIERAARAAGLPLASIALDPAAAAALTEAGYRMLIQAVDVLMLEAGVAAFKP